MTSPSWYKLQILIGVGIGLPVAVNFRPMLEKEQDSCRKDEKRQRSGCCRRRRRSCLRRRPVHWRPPLGLCQIFGPERPGRKYDIIYLLSVHGRLGRYAELSKPRSIAVQGLIFSRINTVGETLHNQADGATKKRPSLPCPHPSISFSSTHDGIYHILTPGSAAGITGNIKTENYLLARKHTHNHEPHVPAPATVTAGGIDFMAPLPTVDTTNV
ncbi:hypothetical protein BDN70DRAFT_959117 [Pholiota conissans]|uniref:Uncharacterized protein n=1 Tax=Pholiota conissans TaxID=109636 RepID=A0A9P5ZBC5_9AGAR|nr:hypothetical protein BDN70DRAFT_959117 [Pholiota conissans]